MWYTMIEYYISCKNTTYQTEDVMRTENEEIRDHLKYLSLLARDYPFLFISKSRFYCNK